MPSPRVLLLVYMAVAAWQAAGRAQELDCAERIQAFIERMDATLDRQRPSVATVEALLAQYFPMSRCDVEQFTAAVKRSKYFFSAYDDPNIKDVAAQSVEFHLRSPDFNVYFNLAKLTGTTELHAAAAFRKY